MQFCTGDALNLSTPSILGFYGLPCMPGAIKTDLIWVICCEYHPSFADNEMCAFPCHSTSHLSRQFLCPISMDIMLDPVVVGGSGNTYDRKSIEKHFQHCALAVQLLK